ncbi:MAG TPA: hypothetical protein VN924_11890 [Bryobacteraceae bacterium]|nr:hypothetical protein [Bryobacteraceae bacterium]
MFEGLVKSPGFAFYSVLLKPLPYRDPGRLVVALDEGKYPVSPADFLDYQAQVQDAHHHWTHGRRCG